MAKVSTFVPRATASSSTGRHRAQTESQRAAEEIIAESEHYTVDELPLASRDAALLAAAGRRGVAPIVA